MLACHDGQKLVKIFFIHHGLVHLANWVVMIIDKKKKTMKNKHCKNSKIIIRAGMDWNDGAQFLGSLQDMKSYLISLLYYSFCTIVLVNGDFLNHSYLKILKQLSILYILHGIHFIKLLFRMNKNNKRLHRMNKNIPHPLFRHFCATGAERLAPVAKDFNFCWPFTILLAVYKQNIPK